MLCSHLVYDESVAILNPEYIENQEAVKKNLCISISIFILLIRITVKNTKAKCGICWLLLKVIYIVYELPFECG